MVYHGSLHTVIMPSSIAGPGHRPSIYQSHDHHVEPSGQSQKSLSSIASSMRSHSCQRSYTRYRLGLRYRKRTFDLAMYFFHTVHQKPLLSQSVGHVKFGTYGHCYSKDWRCESSKYGVSAGAGSFSASKQKDNERSFRHVYSNHMYSPSRAPCRGHS